jgi:acetoacetyl-CoA synthetase
MAVEIYSQEGKRIDEASGQPGELVCTMPFPSMPIELWGDKTGDMYRKAYFDKFPGVWHHGDFLAFNPKTNGIIMLGRRLTHLKMWLIGSDGVLNPSGVRVEPSFLWPLIQVWIC